MALAGSADGAKRSARPTPDRIGEPSLPFPSPRCWNGMMAGWWGQGSRDRRPRSPATGSRTNWVWVSEAGRFPRCEPQGRSHRHESRSGSRLWRSSWPDVVARPYCRVLGDMRSIAAIMPVGGRAQPRDLRLLFHRGAHGLVRDGLGSLRPSERARASSEGGRAECSGGKAAESVAGEQSQCRMKNSK